MYDKRKSIFCIKKPQQFNIIDGLPQLLTDLIPRGSSTVNRLFFLRAGGMLRHPLIFSVENRPGRPPEDAERMPLRLRSAHAQHLTLVGAYTDEVRSFSVGSEI